MKKKEIYHKKEICVKCDLGDHVIVADTMVVPVNEYVVTEISLTWDEKGKEFVRYKAMHGKVGYVFSDSHIGKTVFHEGIY